MHRERPVSALIIVAAKSLQLLERQPSRVDDAMPIAAP